MTDAPDLNRMTPEEKKRIVAIQNLKLARERKRQLMEEKKKPLAETQAIPPPIDFGSWSDMDEESSSSSDESPILSNGKKITSKPYEPKSRNEVRARNETTSTKQPQTKKQKTNNKPAVPINSEESYWTQAKASILNGNNLYTAGFIFVSMLLQLGLPMAETHFRNNTQNYGSTYQRNIEIPSSKANEKNMDVELPNSNSSNPNRPLSFIT